MILTITEVIDVLKAFKKGKQVALGFPGDQFIFCIDFGNTAKEILELIVAGKNFEVWKGPKIDIRQKRK